MLTSAQKLKYITALVAISAVICKHSTGERGMCWSYYCSGVRESSLRAVISLQEGPSIPNVKFLEQTQNI